MTGLDLPGAAPELRGDGVLLSPWNEDDLPGIVEMADAVGRRWSRSLHGVHTVEDAKRWLAERSAPGRVEWAVRHPATGALVGRTSLHRYEEHPPAAEIGYGVHPAHRGRGVATAAVATVARYAFDDLRLSRLGLVHDVGNRASCTVAIRSGFSLEGVERAALGYPDGRVSDQHRHARLAGDPPGPAGRPARRIEHVEIAAGRLQLRPPAAADAPDSLLMLQDPDVALWNPGPGTLDLDSTLAWCARGADWSAGDHATFSVLDATTGRFLGTVSLHQVDLEQRDAEIGYRVAPWARGRGVATDAVAAATRWAFGALDLVRIGLAHSVANPASCRVAEKAGYPLEGTLRQAFVYGDGTRHDEHLHARLATDRGA